MIKRALSESGCPPHILEVLMEKCHERRWPPGLNSLETRQNNRRTYDNYVCRRIPGNSFIRHVFGVHAFSNWFARFQSIGKQAVLVLSCDNPHMSDDVMVEPGLVMIFAHGVE